MSSVPHVSNWQAGFLSLVPAVETHAKIKFRHLGAERREDAVQEAIAAACANYRTAALQGKLHVVRPGPLADFAVRHVHEGRHVGSTQEKINDVLSVNCQKRRGVRVESYHPKSSAGGSAGWKQIAIEDRKVPIPDLAAFRIDFAQWLRALPHRDRKIIHDLIRGERTCDVADRFGMSDGRISQLRRSFESDWQAFQDEAA